MTGPVLTIGDLESWSFPGTALAVIGHPIAHSLSPAMHGAALALLARTAPGYASWGYFRFDIHPGELPRALGLLHAKGFLGINLTVPHKVIAFGLVREIDEAARPVGAVNTLLRTPGGWRGSNTDGHGLAEGIRESLGLGLGGADILLLGAGGAARAAAVECLRDRCASLRIANRTASRVEGLLEDLRPMAGGIPLSAAGLPNPNVERDGTLVIQATPAGLQPGEPAPIDLSELPRPSAVYDMIYNPPRTSLLEQASDLGIPCSNGLSMLAHQGARSLETWTGVSAAVTAPVMLEAARSSLP
jgi:shikimate dehydrogenase